MEDGRTTRDPVCSTCVTDMAHPFQPASYESIFDQEYDEAVAGAGEALLREIDRMIHDRIQQVFTLRGEPATGLAVLDEQEFLVTLEAGMSATVSISLGQIAMIDESDFSEKPGFKHFYPQTFCDDEIRDIVEDLLREVRLDA